MGPIDPEQTLGGLVAERPALAATLERLRLDYCCGGGRTLAEACRDHGLDPATIAAVLAQLDGPEAAARLALHDLRGATLPELCDHIVRAHHEPLRRELPRISELLATVVRVHAREHPELHDLQRLFTGLAHDLLEHLESEETSVFPAARRVAAGEAPDATLAGLVAEHVTEHAATGDALAALRELAGGYETEAAYCSTHLRLLEALAAFELDLHQHVHEENNLLFPRLPAGTA
jgi:regulator of cell morphogenesis and NO signaling